MIRMRFFALFAGIRLLLSFLLTGCSAKGEPTPYRREHAHVYGDWYDAAPDEEGAPITRQVRYCKICRDEQTRERA